MQNELEIVKLLEKEIEIREGLPHIYGQKFYRWQREFLETKNTLALITAANQIGKSTVLVKNNIEWATNPLKWKGLWRTTPRVFLYFYPSFDVATREFETKWVPEFMPRGEFEKHPQYGWKADYDKKDIKLIRWNSGVSTYFMAYAQAAKMLQATTAHAAFLDEEVPEELFAEIRFRLAATNGFMRMGFTATLGQEFFRLIMEEKGRHELFPKAFKRQISLYDCMHYEDGTPSHWTEERIKELIQSCPNDNEVKRRVFGKFVKTEGLRYPSFSRTNNLIKPEAPVPPDWLVYSAVDIGSGGDKAHPAAITFIAVRPDFKKGRVFRHWNGKGRDTAASDIFQQWMMMRGKRRCVGQYYDYSSRDFRLISDRAGENFQQARKEREFGDNILNSLFKNQMLDIDDIEENYPLVKELENLTHQDRKTLVADDSADATRYCAAPIPWDWEFLNKELNVPVPVDPHLADIDERRREAFKGEGRDQHNMMPEQEIEFWQDFLDA